VTPAAPTQAAWWSSSPYGEPPTTPRKRGPTVASTASRCPRSAAGKDHGLLAVDVEPVGQGPVGPRPACQRPQPAVRRVDVRRRAELGQRLGLVVAPAQHRVLVGRAQRDGATPRLPTGPVDVGAPLGEQAQDHGAAPAPHRVRHEGALARVRPALEQERHVLGALLVECRGQRVRPHRRRPRLQEQAQAGRVVGVGGVVDGLPVVGVGPRREEHGGQLGVVDDAGRAVERRHVPEAVAEGDVRVGAAGEQLAGEGG
jgi:hypothetical protein